jgi:hypothetical protein
MILSQRLIIFSIFIALSVLPLTVGADAANDRRVALLSSRWQIEISRRTGCVEKISDAQDHEMNWVHAARPWGVVRFRDSSHVLVFDHPDAVESTMPGVCDSRYSSASLELKVHRVITEQGSFQESYTLRNTGDSVLSLPAAAGCITVPFNDSYEDGAPKCLTNNCNAHLWAGGCSSWANAIRMDGGGRQLGLVLTRGSVVSYSILDGADSNDRGNLAFDLPAIDLKRGESYTITWILFWHEDWTDFWSNATAQASFVRLSTERYSVVKGSAVGINVESASSLAGAVLRANGAILRTTAGDCGLKATLKTTQAGEYVIDLENNGEHSWMKLNVVEDPMALCESRVKLIVDKQQKNSPGDPLDGAYLPYDNQRETQFCDQGVANNHNEARERLAMGVLVALYVPLCKDADLRHRLTHSLIRYEDFIEREIQDPSGAVYDKAKYQGYRIYNYPWVAHLHLATYWATHDPRYLALYVKTNRALYTLNEGTVLNYMIGHQIYDGLRTLTRDATPAAYEEVSHEYNGNANIIEKFGTNYPRSEVNYEQSIVAPSVQIELETYLITKQQAYLNSARKQMKCLEAFNGQQPDYHLHDIAIRHWDDYWFGKLGLYGDTFPHYWTTLSAVAFDEYADATGDESYRARARDIFLSNMCLFTPEGRGSCAYVYPASLGETSGARFDPWANDQDWVWVNWLTIVNRHRADSKSIWGVH